MKIGLDFDGVIADCGRLKSEAALKLYGVEISPDNFKKELVIEDGLLTLIQYRDIQQQIYGTRELGLLLTPVSGAFDYLPQLTKDHQVQIVTSRGEAEVAIAQEWLSKHVSGLEIDFVSVGYGNSKADALKGFKVFVDDDLDKLEPLVGVVPHRFLFSWGYNRHISEGNVAQRVESWAELYQRVSSIANINSE